MAPSGGHILVPKAIKAIKFAISKTGDLVRAKVLANPATSTSTWQAIPARVPKQPLHPAALLRQSQSRSFSTTVRHALSRTYPTLLPSARLSTRAAQPSTLSTLARSSFAKPGFSSALRPQLTAGTLRRTAGTARHFSSTPVSSAHVVQNLSAAARAFWAQGLTARFDGCDGQGRARYRALGAAEASAKDRLDAAARVCEGKGSTLRFKTAPVVTALPLGACVGEETTLADGQVVQGLAADFARSLGALAKVHADLKKLRALGALPVRQRDEGTIEVRFAGCDGETVERLCDELGIERGIVVEDEGWVEPDEATALVATKQEKDVEMALLFPWAPSHPPSRDETTKIVANTRSRHDDMDSVSWRSMMSGATPRPNTDETEAALEEDWVEENPWVSSGEDFDELAESDWDSHGETGLSLARMGSREQRAASDLDPFNGVYRFLTEGDAACVR